MHKSLPMTAAALLLASLSPAAHAADNKSKNAPAAPQQAQQLTPEQTADIRRGAQILRAFNVALQAEQVSDQVKGRLLSCLYNNTLSSISVAAGNAIKQNPEFSDGKPLDVYRAAAGVCGIAFKKQADGAPPPAAQGR